MYHVVKMLGVRRGVGERWRELDILQQKMKDLFSQFRRLIVVARLNSDLQDTYIDLAQFSTVYGDANITVSEMFIEIGGGNVQTLSTSVSINPKHVAWNDAFRAGYRVTPWDRNYTTTIPIQDRPDAILTRTVVETSYEEVHRYCLVTVNGYLHLADTDGVSGVVVYDASKTMRKCQLNHVGILSFKPIAPIRCFPITDRQIKIRSGEDIGDGSSHHFFNSGSLILPQGNENKTVLLSLGGYLITPDTGYLKQVGPLEYVIDWTAYPLVDRVIDSASKLEMPDLGIQSNQRIEYDAVYRDKSLLALLKMSQSFFIVVDTPSLYVEKTKIQSVVGSGIYRIFKDNNCPIVLSTGLLPEYWKTMYSDMITLTLNNGFVQRRVFNTADKYALGAVTEAPIPTLDKKPADAFFMELGVDFQ